MTLSQLSFPLVRSLEENCNDGQPFLLSYLFVNSLYVSIMSPLHLLNLSVGKSKYFSRSTYGRFLHSLNSFVAFLCTFSRSKFENFSQFTSWFLTSLFQNGWLSDYFAGGQPPSPYLSSPLSAFSKISAESSCGSEIIGCPHTSDAQGRAYCAGSRKALWRL